MTDGIKPNLQQMPKNLDGLMEVFDSGWQMVVIDRVGDNTRIISCEPCEAPPTQAQKAAAFDYIVKHADCNSKSSHGLQAYESSTRAKFALRYWCEPAEFEKLLIEMGGQDEG